MRIAFDTNVLISAYTDLEGKGVCHRVAGFVLKSPHHQFLSIEIVLEEFERVMASTFKVPALEIQAILFDLRDEENVPTSKNPPPVPVRDPDDAFVLASALEAEADILVTGDKDLLSLGDKAGIKIVDPRTLLTMLGKEE